MTINSAPQNPAPESPAFSVSEDAARRIGEILTEQSAPSGTSLRVAVDAGGCNGFQYRFKLDDTRHEDDIVIEQGGVSVIVDETSMSLLAGARLEWVDKLMGAHFAVSNPNAASSCGCGSSFSLD
ncbi:iron-sulfur cluster assembly accessory protein [Candidatus Kirkpatrickella diaphorinae]|uniref:Iron-sulfur cluster assembly accessory protein n=1 Tax=Candidatus Kirkpatrickella diaphorinae TaxID=2984322 RepID=A0ABY6GJ39_9PROT|nr:iron-sulfur cluster assembly accessory protein [Candidatus Kirkpatrickella diaphorinae]UYH51543.1 iron-sulfur cluster assembly accessory protein [Candidatus Kirkpatrickella diaphorinae]